MGDQVKQAAEQAACIAGVLTLWDDVNAGSISLDAMKNGVTLAQYYLREAKRLAETGAISADTERAETLRKWLVGKWWQREVMPRQILRFGPNRLRESTAVKSAIQTLEQHGWLVRLPVGTVVDGIARKDVYRIVESDNGL